MSVRRGLGADLGLVVVAVIWGLHFPITKVALSEVPPLAFNAVRMPLAALAVAALLRAQGRQLLPRGREWRMAAVLGLTGHVLFQIGFVFGLKATSASNAALLLATTPVWVVLMGAAFGAERFKSSVLWGSIVTMAGITLLILGDADSIEGGRLGDLFMIGAALSWSIYTVFGKRAVQRHGALEVTGWALWAGTPALVLAGLPQLWDVKGSISLAGWAAVAYSGIFAIAVAYFLWCRGVGSIGQSRTAVYQNLPPVIAVVASWLWLGETLVPLQLAGAAVVVLGLAIARGKRIVPR